MAIAAEEVHQYLNTVSGESYLAKKVVEEKVKTTDSRTLETIVKQYKQFSLVALVSNILLIGIFFLGKPDTTVMILASTIIAAALFFSLYKAQQALITIGIRADKEVDIPLLTILAAGFPFYFLFYIYNRVWVNQQISESNTTV